MEKTRFIDFGDETASSSSNDPSRFDRLREFCHTWERAVKTICLYPSTNPLPGEFRGKFFEALDRLLEDLGNINIVITDAAFTVDKEEIYRHETTDENLAYLFFRDGVCRLSYEQGVTKDESDRFLNAIASVFSSPNAHVDLTNRLWQEALPHIRHFTMDRIIEGAYIDAADDEMLESRAQELLHNALPSDANVQHSPYRGLQSERFKQTLDVFGDVTNLTEQEQTDLAIQLRPTPDEESERLGLEILFEILRTSDHARILEQTINVTEQQYRGSVTNKRWGMVRYILDGWNAVAPQASPAIARQLQSARLRAVDSKNFDELAAYLNESPQGDLHEVRAALEGFGAAALTPITAMLGVLEHKQARLMVCEYLAEHGKDAIDLIGGFVYDKRWFVVRNVTKVLGEIGSSRAVSFLKKAAQHGDARVRLEALKALQQTADEASIAIMLEMLDDEDDTIHRRALHALGETGSAKAAAAVRKEIDRLPATSFQIEELRELYTAYARCGGKTAVEYLKKIAKRSPLFGRRRWLDARLAAIHALSGSPVLEVRAELSALAMSRTREIAKTARDAETLWGRRQAAVKPHKTNSSEGTAHDDA